MAEDNARFRRRQIAPRTWRRVILCGLVSHGLALAASAQAPAPTAADLFDLTPGDHALSPHFGYEVEKARLMFYHLTEGAGASRREHLGTLPIDDIIIRPRAPRAGFAVSEDGLTLLYVHMAASPFFRPSPPRDLEAKTPGLYEYVHGRGDRLIHDRVNLVGSSQPVAGHAVRFGRSSSRGTYIRTTEGAESVEDEAGWTPLHRAAFAGDVPSIQRLAQEGAALEAHDGKDLTPLHTAVLNGQEAASRALLEAGADVNARTPSAQTPLHQAAWLGHTDIVAALLAGSADVNAKGKEGKTPLHDALWTGRYETASYLVTHGADLAARNSRGDTPLHALAAFNLDEHGLLLRNDERALKAADSPGSPRETLLKLMIQQGADASARNNDGATPLEISVRNKRSVTTQILRQSAAAGP